MKKVAFFDIDGTLYNGNLGFEVGKYLVGIKLVSRLVLLRGFVLWILYRAGIISYDAFGSMGLSLIKEALTGRDLNYVLKVAEDFYDCNVISLNETGLRFLQELKGQGFFIVLITGEPDFLVRPFIARVGADVAITTEVEFDKNGRFTGKILESLATNKGKHEAFKRFVERERVDLASSVAVGDSEGDLGMFEACGRAVCVNPSEGLLKTAKERGWEVV